MGDEASRRLFKPQMYGFQRVCLVQTGSHGSKLVNVHYLGPEDKEGKRKSLRTKTMVGEAIKDFERLQQENFCFKRLRYNLPTEFEVEEAYTKPLPVNGIIGSSSTKSIYNEFMTENSSRTAQCTLCGSEICRNGFSRHMQRFHLSDETCTSCGLDFRPDLFPSHVVKCVSEGKSNIKHVSGSSRKGDVTMTGSSSGERRDCEDEMDEASTSDPLRRRKGDAENDEVLHGEKQMGSENEYCSVE